MEVARVTDSKWTADKFNFGNFLSFIVVIWVPPFPAMEGLAYHIDMPQWKLVIISCFQNIPCPFWTPQLNTHLFWKIIDFVF